MLICPVCGKKFEPNHPMRKYCSEECREVAQKTFQQKWRYKKKLETRDLVEARAKRRRQDKRRRIDAAVKITEEMGLRGRKYRNREGEDE